MHQATRIFYDNSWYLRGSLSLQHLFYSFRLNTKKHVFTHWIRDFGWKNERFMMEKLAIVMPLWCLMTSWAIHCIIDLQVELLYYLLSQKRTNEGEEEKRTLEIYFYVGINQPLHVCNLHIINMPYSIFPSASSSVVHSLSIDFSFPSTHSNTFSQLFL